MDNIIEFLTVELNRTMDEYNNRVKELNKSSSKVVYSLEDNDPKCRFLYGYATGLNKQSQSLRQVITNN